MPSIRSACLIPILTLAASAACSNDPIVCTAQFVPAVVVEVRDSMTEDALAAGARGSVRDGTFLDSLRPFTSASLQGAGERPGTYTVTIVHPGYADWLLADVRVHRDVCHVVTVNLQARLQPAP
jgi:hypothetical protein